MATRNTALVETSVDRATALGERWLAAWNAHDPERLLELLAPDIVYRSDAWPRTMRRPADVFAFTRAMWTAFPDLQFELTSGPYLTPAEPRAAFHWHARGTHTGQLVPPGYAPTGKRLDFDGVDLHEYYDDKLARVRSIFDNLSIARQLGFVPRRRSVPAQRATVQAQRTAGHVREVLRRRAER